MSTVDNDPQAVAYLQQRCEELTAELTSWRTRAEQNQRYAAEMEAQRDEARRAQAAAVHRANTVEDTNKMLLGQIEDMRAALATAEALDRSQVDGRWTAIWDRCG